MLRLRAGAVFALVIALGALAGCTPVEVPQFAGPWSAEFAQAYSATDNRFVREAIKDGTVTDEEYAEMFERFRSCLDAVGITLTLNGHSYRWDIPDGSDAARANGQFDRCSVEAGENYIGWLYYGVKRNPDNLDESQIVSACLVRAGVVPENYSAADYESDNEEQTYPFFDKEQGKKAHTKCLDDPLGLLE